MEQNPKTQRKWRYTWEAQSHSPNLRLFLFDSTNNPKIHCKSLDVSIILGKSQLLVTWINDEDEVTSEREEVVSLRVPVPRVLIDAESPVSFRAWDDHIEVKLVLLLPVDNPLFSDFNLLTDSVNDREKSSPLVMDYDAKSLSSIGGVHFYCRNCSIRLTNKILTKFSEMPSSNWRESADNWFGNCCCSFGEVSEKMVAKYTNSFTYSSGLCLLSATTVLLSKDDLIESILSESGNQFESSCDLGGVEPSSRSSEGDANSHGNGDESIHKLGCVQVDDGSEANVLLSEDDIIECILSDKIGIEKHFESSCDLGGVEPGSRSSEGNAHSHGNGDESIHGLGCVQSDDCSKANATSHENGDESIHGLGCGQVDDSILPCIDTASMHGCCVHESPASPDSKLDQQLTLDKKFLLDGFLEDVFMAKASNVSKNIEWIEFVCPECSSPLGAYPSSSRNTDNNPIDGGVRLFKCNISTSTEKSSDVFRNYTLETMFTNQLMEFAKEELSFHVLIKDLTTKSPLFRIILLNPNSWSLTGLCSTQDEQVSPLELSPIVKVLFSECNGSLVVKKIDEEVYILKRQGDELMKLLKNSGKFLPGSCSCLQGSLVSSLHL